MKVLFINSVCGIRSTGRIVTETAEQYMANGHICKIAYGREDIPEQYKEISYRIGNDKEVSINGIKARLFDNEGFNAKRATQKLIQWANNYNPDVLWLHNLHGYYINIELLFNWIKSRPNMEVKWTLHDCWAFTGHCSHFSYIKCQRWKTHCYACVQHEQYPASLFVDRCKHNFEAKKNAFCGVEKMTLIVPSHWLESLVLQSFLKEYPVKVVHNTIDTTQFKPTESDFRQRYGLVNKKIVLGVSSVWTDRKGLFDFYALAKKLDATYQIVLVGKLSSALRKRAPKKIIFIERTDSRKELAAIYSAADVFFNPSKEETFGLTTLEAIACDTDSIVYENTACQEVVDAYGGISVSPDIEIAYQTVRDVTSRVFQGKSEDKS